MKFGTNNFFRFVVVIWLRNLPALPPDPKLYNVKLQANCKLYKNNATICYWDQKLKNNDT